MTWHKDQWRTANEIDYINTLVAGILPEGRSMAGSVASRLERYLASARRRIEWDTFGAVDGKKIVQYVSDIIETSNEKEGT